MSKPVDKLGARVGFGCLTLFALPFAGFAVFMACKAIALVSLAVETQSWVETPATLNRVTLDRSSKGDGATYAVTAEYRYEYDGRPYVGDRVGISTDKDNLKRYHERLYERLKAARDAGEPVTCYVDPGDPSRAILVRRLRWTSLMFHVPFVAAFGLVGFGLLIGAGYAYRKTVRLETLQAAEPERPWLWREDWKLGVVESTGRDRLLAAGYGGFLWNVLAWPIALLLWSDEADTGWWGIAAVSLFPLVGVGLVAWWGRLLVQRRRYGESKLRLATLPGVIGGRLTGAILAPTAVTEASGVRVALKCRRTTGDGDGQKTRVVWQEERKIERTLDSGEPGRVGVPVAFTIPSDCLSTAENEVEWKLTAHAKLPGVDYEAQFAVPVFRTADSKNDVTAGSETDSERENDIEQAVPLNRLLAEQGIEAAELGTLGGYRYASAAGRATQVGVVLTLVTLVFAVTAGVLLSNGVWLFGGVTSLFVLLLLFATLDGWLGRSELRITPVGWQATDGWWGFPSKPKKFVAEEVRSIEAAQSSSSGDTVHYRVQAWLPGDKRAVLVRNVSGATAARRLVEHLRAIAGVETDAPAIGPELSLKERREARLNRRRS
ncbi:MAG: DUF3592 domain-containing protein [Planctomycetota bacterium]